MEVTKSDFNIEFSVVDLVEKMSGSWILSWLGAFFKGKNRKVGCLQRNSASRWIVEFKQQFSDTSTQNLALINKSGLYDVISTGCKTIIIEIQHSS